MTSDISPARDAAPLPLTVRAWLQAYRSGASPRALLVRCHSRALESHTPAAWIHLASQAEMEGQIDALEQLAAGHPDRAALIESHPLFGVPFAVKDNIDIAGVPTTAGCPAYERTALQTAAAVLRLQAAGAVWLGKTNLDQFATGLVGTRSPYGQLASAFGADYISGGSSSGSAVAVATGLVAFSLGTDTAGSGRVPAAFNQIVGLKPTPGRVSAGGMVPACRTLDCMSVFALTVEDAAHVLSVIEGADEADGYSHFEPGPAAWPQLASGGLRVGIPAEPVLAEGSGYAEAYAAALAHARSLGHTLVPMSFELLHRTAELLYSGPWVAERYSVVGELMEREPEAIDPVVRAVIGRATAFSAADAFKAQYALKDAQREAKKIWDTVDLLLVPTAPGHPRFSDIAADPQGSNSRLGTYTNFVNLLGWCAMAVPAGSATDSHGSVLPFGVTFIAPSNHDAALAVVARAWQDSIALPLGATQLKAGAAAAQAPEVRLRPPATHPSLPIAVVGAHLSGMPLNGQLLERGARLLRATRTAPHYRLYALPGTTPPKPGLARVAGGGCAIALEVWDMPMAAVGSLLALIPAPLGLGSIELEDGSRVHGFLCEAHALAQAEDISRFGGWRAYMQSLSKPPAQAAGNAH